MAPELYWVRDIAPLRLAVMPRPRGDDWLREEVSGWVQCRIDTVVSLLQSGESRELGLRDEAALCLEHAIQFVSFPIPDRGTPSSIPATAELVHDLVTQLRSGRGVAVHCRAGIGRTGILGACILLRLGVPLPEVFPMLSRSRTLPMPDTQAQLDWVARFKQEARIAL